MQIIMKRIITTVALACVALLAFGQKQSIIRPRIELVEVETEIDEAFTTELEVFYMNDENPRMYYLSLGHLGVGTDIIQVQFDPVFELFIPLGGTLDEAIAKMQEIKDFYKAPRKSTMELNGCFAVAYPNNEIIPVKVTRRQFVTKVLEFSLPTEGTQPLVRATHIGKNDFGSLLSSLKLYKKLHPKEK